jgi:hypothetical protein
MAARSPIEESSMDNEQQAVSIDWQWKDVPDKQRWVVAWGVLWRIWVFSAGVYGAILLVVLLVALVVAATSS